MKNEMGYGSDPVQRPVSACDCGDHVFVNLTPWGCTLASPEDADLLGSRSWSLRRVGRQLYAHSSGRGPGPLHRVINATPKGMDTDHIFGNTLDNRRPMLRSATRSQNNRNRHAAPTGASGYIGVTFHRASGRWRGYVNHLGRQVSAGYHDTARAAATARDDLLRRLLPGELVMINGEDQ